MMLQTNDGPVWPCRYEFLDAGKACGTDADCDASLDPDLTCRDFDDGRFCSRSCTSDYGPLVCVAGFYRLPTDVPLPAYSR